MSESQKRKPILKGALFGLGAAFLFGCSMPLAKQLLGDIQPFLLAGLFYLGSGLGLSAWIQLRRNVSATTQAPLRKADLPWLSVAVLFGGILAELLLMYGLKQTTAAEASLLLNLEGAFSALIAWVVFREHANVRVVAGMILLTAGAMFLAVGTNWQIHLSVASLCIVAACFGWAIDNNLTRRISHVDPVAITAIKGVVAGTVNVSLGLAAGGHVPSAPLLALSMIVGLLSYGVSLVFFILSMRYIGAARTSAYWSAAPFIGAITSIIFLHEPVSVTFAIAAALMAAGIWLHLTETHEHEHAHSAITHEHEHVHDAHHQHTHNPEDPQGEPHSHAHVHNEIVHSHPHLPDIHHRHIH